MAIRNRADINRCVKLVEERMRTASEEAIAELTAPNREPFAGVLASSSDTPRAPGRTRPAWEHAYERNAHNWDEDTRKVRTPKADLETVQFFQAVIDNDQSRLREIEARQVRPEYQRADLSTTVGGVGLVPSGFYQQVMLLQQRVAKMRSLVTVIPMGGDVGSTMKVPTVTTQPVPTVVAEGGDLTTGTDPVLGSVTLTPVKIGQVIKLSRELVEDSPMATASLIGQLVAEALGYAEDLNIINGTAADFTDNLEDDATASADTWVDASETLATLASKLYELPLDAIANSTWLINIVAAEALSALTDTNARQVFLPFDPAPSFIGPNEGGAGMLLGRPVRVFPTAIIPSNVAFVGDMRAYTLLDRETIRVVTDTSAFFGTDQIGLHVSRRVDGAMAQATKIRKHPAA